MRLPPPSPLLLPPSAPQLRTLGDARFEARILDSLDLPLGREVQEGEQEKDRGNGCDEDEGPQQEENSVALVETAERIGRRPRPANRQQSLPNLDLSLEPDHNETRNRNIYNNDDELNSTDSDEDDQDPRSAKRKQPSSSHGGPTRKKRRRR
jgi:hypothetical protein